MGIFADERDHALKVLEYYIGRCCRGQTNLTIFFIFGMEPPISPLMQNQEKKVGVMDSFFLQKRLDFPRFWAGSQNMRKSSRFRAKQGPITPTFFS